MPKKTEESVVVKPMRFPKKMYETVKQKSKEEERTIAEQIRYYVKYAIRKMYLS